MKGFAKSYLKYHILYGLLTKEMQFSML